MDQERPRSDLSINSRNHLRKVLHLEVLYKENKVHAFNVWYGVLERNVATSKALMSPARSSETSGRRLAIHAVREKQSRLRADKSQLCVWGFQPELAAPHWPTAPRVRSSGAHFEPEPATIIPGAPSSPHEAIFSKTVLKNIAFSYAKNFHSLLSYGFPSAVLSNTFFLRSLWHLIQADAGLGFS